MARASKGPGQNLDKPRLCISREDAERELTTQIKRGKGLRHRTISDLADLKQATNERYSWDEYNETLLSQIFDNDSVAKEYRGFYVGGPDANDLIGGKRYFEDEMDRSIRKLESVVQRLNLYDLNGIAGSPAAIGRPARGAGRGIFIVHGHDEAAKNEVARFIQNASGSAPQILHQLPNQGRTIIEKLEHYGRDAGFAVVLLTADDLGGKRVEVDGRGLEALKGRARQNVILELGYFVGLLGRSRVCALHSQGVELPSDYEGVLFVPLDAGAGWKLELARELKSAGYTIDLDALLGS